MVTEAIPADVDEHDAMFEFFDEMECEHNLFLSVSQFDDVVLDEREEEL